MKALYLTVALLFLAVSSAWGQSDVGEEAGQLQGRRTTTTCCWRAPRRKERSSGTRRLGGKSYKTIKAEFAKKYPDVKIDVYRAGQPGPRRRRSWVSTRPASTWWTPPRPPRGIMHAVSRKAEYPHALHAVRSTRRWPDEHQIKAKSGGVWWVTDRESFIGLGYNTKKLSKDQVPKSFDDLLNPALKGKLMMSITKHRRPRSSSTMLKVKGEEYVEKLKKQQLKLREDFRHRHAGPDHLRRVRCRRPRSSETTRW